MAVLRPFACPEAEGRGSGTGDDTAALAATAGDVFAVGFDLSATHVAEAIRRWRGAGVTFAVADGHALPVAEATLDACRVERTLQHVEDPALVIAEIARSLRPGGRLAVSEPDWETCVVAGGDAALGRTVISNWIPGRNRQPDVGRRLPGLFADGGFVDVRVFGASATYDTFANANYYFPLARAARQAVEDGIVAGDDAEQWVADLQQASERGQFLFAVTIFTAIGVRGTY
jgi:SAM-dependent methyltransferase